MQVTYKGNTEEFVSLVKDYDLAKAGESPYVLSIFDYGEIRTHVFGGVNLKDISLVGGEN